MKALSLFVFSFLLIAGCEAQKKTTTLLPTPGSARLQSVQGVTPELKGLKALSIGPTIMSGRVVDIVVNPNDPTEFYVAYASGGVWHTTNNGTSFIPVADQLPTQNMGDLDVLWTQPRTLFVGGGESNSSRSSYSGLGLFMSADGGSNWNHLGLVNSHHISRVSVYPQSKDSICVASMGPLYSAGGEQGIFITADGGKTWKNTFNAAGVIDLVRDPSNPDHLFMAAWQRSREAWNFVESGSESGIYESFDNGLTWQRISAKTGFPEGAGCGRIGLAVYNGSKGLHLYAMVDNQAPRLAQEDTSKTLKKDDFNSMSAQLFLNLDSALLASFLSEQGFPEKYTVDYLKKEVANKKIAPSALADYLYDANQNLFDTPVTGAEVYRFKFDEQRWEKTHETFLDDVVYTYGYYFGVIAVDPANPQTLYIAGVPLLVSHDGGKNWAAIQGDNQHVDHHVVWANPFRKGHLINGNDGGVNISYDEGQSWIKCNTPAVGQFYAVAVDQADPYRVYGGLQDNGVWRGPHTYEASTEWHQSGRYPYEFLMGGDGMQIAIDPRDNETVYTGYQFGHYYKLHPEERSVYIHPAHELGERPLRWNWETPILLSEHQPEILYIASNKLHRSLDAGHTWETLSGDLTRGGKSGDVPFGTCTVLAESPLRFGRLYIGTDDGRLHRTDDAGFTYTDISLGLPELWVSSIEPSYHSADVVYASLNGYRNDHFNAYLYRSTDAGKTWKALAHDLPLEPVNCLIEDPSNAQVLFVGTDGGLYVTIDGGSHFMRVAGVPRVAVHDLVIHQSSGDLIVGTHGRSLYRIPLPVLRAFATSPDQYTCVPNLEEKYRADWGKDNPIWMPIEERTTTVWITAPMRTEVEVILIDESGKELKRDLQTLEKGPNEVPVSIAGAWGALQEGNYTIQFQNHCKSELRIVK